MFALHHARVTNGAQRSSIHSFAAGCAPRTQRTLIAALIGASLGLAGTTLHAAPGQDHSQAGADNGRGAQIAQQARERAQARKAARAAESGERARRAGNDMVHALKEFEEAKGSDRSLLARMLAERVAERQRELAELVQVDPAAAIAQATPAELRERMPAEAQQMLESEVEATGVVVGTLVDDLESGRHEHHLYLETGNGASGQQRLGLHVAGRADDDEKLMSLIDRRVRMRALRVGNRLAVANDSQIEMAAAPGNNGKGNNGKGSGSGSTSSGTTTTTTSGSTTAPTATVVSGDQRTLVIMGNFQDRNVGCSAADINNRMFGATSSVNQILKDSSRGAVTVSGQVVGPFTIPFSANGVCDYNAWGTALDNAARAAGIDTSRFQRLAYAVPTNSTCGFGGIANLGGSIPTRSWTLECQTTGLIAHELSHNLRFQHASTPSAEYGDYSDPMGYTRTVLMNGPNRVMAGWLTGSSVIDAKSSGTFTISTLGTSQLGTAEVIRVPKPDTGEFYYLSSRQSLSLDTNLGSIYKNVVSVHRSTGTMPAKTFLLATLAAGQSYTDATNGLKFSANSITADNAAVSVQLPGSTVPPPPVCALAGPTLSVSPASQTAAAGGTLNYQLTLKNNNSSACAPATFAMSQKGPAGFSGAFSSTSVPLASGATTSLNWSVASAATLADGVYSINAQAAQSGTAAASTPASYVVYTPITKLSVNLTNPADGAVLAAAPITFSVDACDPVRVTRVEFWLSGMPVGTAMVAPFQLRFDATRWAGTRPLEVRAYNAKNESVTQKITVTFK